MKLKRKIAILRWRVEPLDGVREVVKRVTGYAVPRAYETYVVTYNRLRRGGHRTLYTLQSN
jgi:hypothetical protein